MQRLPYAIAVSFCCFLCACIDQIDCTGDYLFRDWTGSAFTSADGGAQVPPPYLDLSSAHYGPGQDFYSGGCQYQVDIETDLDESSGVFSFSHANPATPDCIRKEGTQTWALDCDTLSVTTPDGTITFTDATPADAGSADGGG